jgi:hypothetical protein
MLPDYAKPLGMRYLLRPKRAGETSDGMLPEGGKNVGIAREALT